MRVDHKGEDVSHTLHSKGEMSALFHVIQAISQAVQKRSFPPVALQIEELLQAQQCSIVFSASALPPSSPSGRGWLYSQPLIFSGDPEKKSLGMLYLWFAESRTLSTEERATIMVIVEHLALARTCALLSQEEGTAPFFEALLLEGQEDTDDLVRRARWLSGTDLYTAHLVACVELVREAHVPREQVEHVVTNIVEALHSRYPHSLTRRQELDRLVGLIDLSAHASNDLPVYRSIEQLIATLRPHFPEIRLYVGLSDVIESPSPHLQSLSALYRTGYQQAQEALRYISPSSKIARLLKLEQTVLPFAETSTIRYVVPLLEGPPDKYLQFLESLAPKRKLFETLLLYFSDQVAGKGSKIEKMAKSLHLHPRAVGERLSQLRTICEAHGMALESPHEARLQIALEAYLRLHPEAQESIT